MSIKSLVSNRLILLSLGSALAACSISGTDKADSDRDEDADGGEPDESGTDGGKGEGASGGVGGSGSGGVGGSRSGGAGGSRSGGMGGSGSGGVGGSGTGGTAGASGSAGNAGAGGAGTAGSSGQSYEGPVLGTANQFAVLAYNAVTSANPSTIVGHIGVSAAAISTITGFDDPTPKKYGSDSLAPDDGLTRNAQGDVTALVGNIDPRACDHDLTDVVGGLTGDVTLQPGVTCMKSFSADVLINGHVYLDAGGDANAFFIIRGNKTLTVADGAQIVLQNEARACSVFWRISEAVSLGKTVEFHGTVIAGTAITMKTASSLNGRAFAQTAGVHLDANTVKAPTEAECPHVQ